MLLKPSTNMVVQTCLYSRALMYQLWWGAHTACRYSRCGHTLVMKSFLKFELSMLEWKCLTYQPYHGVYFFSLSLWYVHRTEVMNQLFKDVLSETESASVNWKNIWQLFVNIHTIVFSLEWGGGEEVVNKYQQRKVCRGFQNILGRISHFFTHFFSPKYS